MDINIDSSLGFYSTGIASLALIVSAASVYFQFFRKSKKLICNLILPPFKRESNLRETGLVLEIALSNEGNTQVLLTDIKYYYTTDNFKINDFPTDVYQIDLPYLFNPGKTVAIKIGMEGNFYEEIIKKQASNEYDIEYKARIFLFFQVIVSGKSILISIPVDDLIINASDHNLIIHNYRSEVIINNILNKKYTIRSSEDILKSYRM